MRKVPGLLLTGERGWAQYDRRAPPPLTTRGNKPQRSALHNTHHLVQAQSRAMNVTETVDRQQAWERHFLFGKSTL